MIAHLSIQHLRNLSQLDLFPVPSFNLLVGPNGSGKSSILEAIHLLSLGRSFRTHLHPRVIQNGEDSFCIYASFLDGQRVGVEKSRSQQNRIHLNGESLRSQAEIAERLPIQLIHPDGYELITGSAKGRRQYLDWGTFHVEHQFFNWWRRSQRILQHRNLALKQQVSKMELQAWNNELCGLAEQIHTARLQYFEQLSPVIDAVLSKFLDVDITLSYFRGWDDELSLHEVLLANEARDRAMGYTQKGPQRADIKIRVGKTPAADVLSRGQLKLLVCALRLAQGMDYKRQSNRPCLFLLDDLTSELDLNKRHQLLQALTDLQAQVFITSVEPGELGDFHTAPNAQLFHVEQLRGLSVVSDE